MTDLRITLDSVVTENFDNNEFLKLFKNFNITDTQQDIDKFVANVDESCHVFQEEILAEPNHVFEEQQAVNANYNIHQMSMSQWMLILLFKGYKLVIFSKTFTLSVILEGDCLQQIYKLMLVTTMESYNPLLITFKIF